MKNFTEHKLLPYWRLFSIDVVNPFLEYEIVSKSEENYQSKNLTSNDFKFGKCPTYVTYIKSVFPRFQKTRQRIRLNKHSL